MTHLTLTTQLRKKPDVTQIMVDHELIIMQATNGCATKHPRCPSVY